MRKTVLALSLFVSCLSLFSQELNCNIQIVTQQIQGTNKQIFETMQGAIYEFMNNTSWTSNVFELNERIECNMLFNLQEQVSDEEFKGTLQIQVRRPVYNSSYNTVLFNYVDNDLNFKYVEYQPLQFNENTHLLNLTSILAYYAYIILGLDYDSFSYEGGTEFFQKAEKIVNNAQNTPEKGWKSIDSQSRKNRYWLIDNILNEDFSPAREFMYRYHRLGLDMMYDKVNEARAEMAESLKLLQQVYRNKPDPFMHFLQVIYDAKSDEFVNIFRDSFQDEKTRVFAILNEIDPANTNKYEAILK
jgi:hypothetical protein